MQKEGEALLNIQDLGLLNKLKVGIVGCGHLGQAIALSLVAHGLEKENLLISYRGNPLTYKKLETKGLASCLTNNKRLFMEAGIILIITKPQDILKFHGIVAADKSLIVSCMAGIPIELLNRIFKTNTYRMMFSGPDTILSEKGVATAYPQNEHLELLTRFLNLKYIQIDAEKDMDTFTAGVCLPAAILKLDNSDGCSDAIGRVEEEFPLLSKLYKWASESLPIFQSSTETDMYIEQMKTKGGITEAILNSLQKGEALDAALQKGIDHAKEISVEIQKSKVTGAVF